MELGGPDYAKSAPKVARMFAPHPFSGASLMLAAYRPPSSFVLPSRAPPPILHEGIHLSHAPGNALWQAACIARMHAVAIALGRPYCS